MFFPNCTIITKLADDGTTVYHYHPTICAFEEGVIWSGEEHYVSSLERDEFLRTCAIGKARDTIFKAFQSLFSQTEKDEAMDAFLAQIRDP